jgi:hypothetical protein
MQVISSKRMVRSAVFLSAALMILSGCSDAGPLPVASNASCKLKSFNVEYDKSRMCVYTCKGGELEGRTRTAAQGPCLNYVPSAK